MRCAECLSVFEAIGNALNSPIDTHGFLTLVAKTLVKSLKLKGCQFRLLSRDSQTLDHVAAFGLSRRFLNKGPVASQKSGPQALLSETVLVSDCAHDPRIQYPEAFAAEGISSMLTVPMRTRGQVIGVMRLFAAEQREYSEQELEVIKVVCAFCTSAILHAMFHAILASVTSTVRSSLQLDTVLEGIARTTTEELRAKGCTIRLTERDRGALQLKAAYGLSEEYLTATRDSFGEGLKQALGGTCVQVLRASSDTRVLHGDAAEREGIASILFLPLVVHDKTIGVLSLYTHGPWEFSEEEVYLMTAIAEQCALAIQNAQMYEAVRNRYDSLMEDFHRWFDHVTYTPDASRGGSASITRRPPPPESKSSR